MCSTDDRYEDDIHYKGGCLLNENLGWAATMLAYSSRPPDPKIVGTKWRKMWLERLKAEPFLLIPWLQHPHRDAYWKHGSVCENFSAIDARCALRWRLERCLFQCHPRLMKGLRTRGKPSSGPGPTNIRILPCPNPASVSCRKCCAGGTTG